MSLVKDLTDSKHGVPSYIGVALLRYVVGSITSIYFAAYSELTFYLKYVPHVTELSLNIRYIGHIERLKLTMKEDGVLRLLSQRVQ